MTSLVTPPVYAGPHAPLDRAGLLARARLEVMPFVSAERQLEDVPTDTVITVTCSPKHGVERTLDFSDGLRACGFAVIPHVAARMVRDAAHVSDIARRLRDGGYEELFVIGGDQTPPMGAYRDAAGLLEALAPQVDSLRIGIGGYPEGHPSIAPEALTAALLAKQRFAGVLATQICFDAAAIVRWIRGIRAAGVTLPVLVGVPGVVDRRKLLALSARVGVGASTRYLRKNLRTATVLLRRTTYRPDRLVDELAAATADPELGVAGLHLFTFNEIAATSAWRSTTDPRRTRDGH